MSAFLGLHHQSGPSIPPRRSGSGDLEESHLFLSRLLLMLGSLVVFCLLLF